MYDDRDYRGPKLVKDVAVKVPAPYKNIELHGRPGVNTTQLLEYLSADRQVDDIDSLPNALQYSYRSRKSLSPRNTDLPGVPI